MVTSIRLVNRHWGKWASESIGFVGLPTATPLGPALNTVAAKFPGVHGLGFGAPWDGTVTSPVLWPQSSARSVFGAEGKERALSFLGYDKKLVVLADWEYTAVVLHWHLTRLHLNECMNDDALEAVGNLTSLRQFELSPGWEGEGKRYLVTDKGLVSIAKCTALTHLTLNGCWLVTASGLGHLGEMATLVHLHLHHCHFTDAGLAHLGRLTSLTHLSLRVTFERVTPSGLAVLWNLQELTHVDLAGCEAIGTEALRQVGYLKRIVHLDLYGCGEIGPLGVKCIGALTTLTSLNLGNCLLTDEDIRHIHALTLLTSLEFGDYTGECKLLPARGIA